MPSSGTGGPCAHCHRTQSCCWRRGPAAKPVLCNSCGARYLVKKSLEGYIPIQLRTGMAARPPSQAKPRAKQAPAAPRGEKRRRHTIKTLDAAVWAEEHFDSDESEGAYFEGDSGGEPASSGGYYDAPAAAAAAARGARAARSLLGDAARASKVLRIATEEELRELGPAVLAQLLGASHRLKPRKPINPSISVVF